MTVIEILHMIRWFTRRNQNWVIVTLAWACPKTPYLKTLPLKRDPGPYQHHKILKYISRGEQSLFGSHSISSKWLSEIKLLFWLSSQPFCSSSVDSSLVVISWEQYITLLVEGLEKWTDGFLPCLFFHSSWPSFQWNPHAPWPILQEVHHLYFLLVRVVVDVVRYLVYETTGFLVTHYGSSFMEFLGVLPL